MPSVLPNESHVIQFHFEISQDVSTLLRRGDMAALNDLMDWYRPLLMALANRDLDPILRSKVDVSDIVQETCHDVVRSFSELQADNRGQFVGFLKTVLKNKLTDLRRRFLLSKKRCVFQELPLGDLPSSQLVWLSGVNPSPMEDMLRNEDCDRLKVVLGRLPRELQRLLRWRFRKGLTYREIGLKISRSDDNVRVLINRCLDRVRAEVCVNGSTR